MTHIPPRFPQPNPTLSCLSTRQAWTECGWLPVTCEISSADDDDDESGDNDDYDDSNDENDDDDDRHQNNDADNDDDDDGWTVWLPACDLWDLQTSFSLPPPFFNS